MGTITHNVSTTDVRTALNNISADALPDATISDAIDDAKLHVESRLPADFESSPFIDLPDDWDEMTTSEQETWKQDRIDSLVKHVAKRKAFNSSGAEVNVSAMEASVSLDINAFRGQLRRDVEQAWEAIGLVEPGDSTAFIDATGSVFDDNHSKS